MSSMDGVRYLAGENSKLRVSRNMTKRRHRSFRRKQPKTWCAVYTLRDPRDSKIFYVGQTRLHISERLRWHFKAVNKAINAGRRLSPVQKRLKELTAANLKPAAELLELYGRWDITEAVWIDRLRQRGETLLNVLSLVD